MALQNITAQSENGIFISGRVGGVANVTMRNVHLLIQQNPVNNASFGPCPSHNYWPSSHAGAWNGTTAPIDGVYVEHAANVSVDGLSVTFVGAPKPGNSFGRCFRSEPSTTKQIAVTGMRCVGQAEAPHGVDQPRDDRLPNRSTVQS